MTDASLFNQDTIESRFRSDTGRSETSDRHLKPCRMLVVFGTRPELIKLFPLIRAAKQRKSLALKTVLTSQHTDLVDDLVERWDVPIDFNLNAMREGQTLNELSARIIRGMDEAITTAAPDVVVVQGDTTSAFGAALAAWHRQVPVAHIEAGLRTATIASPFPEEANRRLISRIASLHFAPTARSVAALKSENVPESDIVLSGNTVVDAISLIREREKPTMETARLLEMVKGQRLIVFTLHRREGFGDVLRERMKALSAFVKKRPDISVIFPVHPNPNVRKTAHEILGDQDRVHLVKPLSYPDFLHCLSASWAIVSDSGGIQEEAPSLGKPLLILRGETERPEAVECGVARLVGSSVREFAAALNELDEAGSWAEGVSKTENPFGDGHAAHRIADAIATWHTASQVEAGLETVL